MSPETLYQILYSGYKRTGPSGNRGSILGRGREVFLLHSDRKPLNRTQLPVQ